jgi:ABC-type spermidine/putrescine transport system permease subunit II
MGFDPSKAREMSEEELQKELVLLQPGRSLHTACKLELDRRQQVGRRDRRWRTAWTTLLIALTTALLGVLLGKFL